MIDQCLFDLGAHDTVAHPPSSSSPIETADAMAQALHVQYELVCVDTVQSEEDAALGIFFPLEGVTSSQFEQAHRVAFALLDYCPTDRSQHQYVGQDGAKIVLEETTGGQAFAEFGLAKLDVKAIAAVAEIAAVMRCELVPRDGGSALVPTTEALLLDLAHRAAQKVCPDGPTFFDAACAQQPELRDSELVWNLPMASPIHCAYVETQRSLPAGRAGQKKA